MPICVYRYVYLCLWKCLVQHLHQAIRARMISAIPPSLSANLVQRWNRGQRRESEIGKLESKRYGPRILAAVVSDDRGFGKDLFENSGSDAPSSTVLGFAHVRSYSLVLGHLSQQASQIVERLRITHSQSKAIGFLEHEFLQVVKLDEPFELPRGWPDSESENVLSDTLCDKAQGRLMLACLNMSKDGFLQRSHRPALLR